MLCITTNVLCFTLAALGTCLHLQIVMVEFCIFSRELNSDLRRCELVHMAIIYVHMIPNLKKWMLEEHFVFWLLYQEAILVKNMVLMLLFYLTSGVHGHIRFLLY